MTIRILLVDDNQTFLSAVRLFLDWLEETSVVGEAHDGSQALVLARQTEPDLVLLDIGLPVISGLEVARALRAQPKSPQLIFLSMHDTEACRLAANEFEPLAFVAKSDFVTKLLPVMESLIATHIEAPGPGTPRR